MKEKEDFEIFCYESDEGSICLEFGEAAVSFSKKALSRICRQA